MKVRMKNKLQSDFPTKTFTGTDTTTVNLMTWSVGQIIDRINAIAANVLKIKNLPIQDSEWYKITARYSEFKLQPYSYIHSTKNNHHTTISTTGFR